jgi:hypothetical protein
MLSQSLLIFGQARDRPAQHTVHDLHSLDFNKLAVRDKTCCLKSPNMFQDLTSYQKTLSLELAESLKLDEQQPCLSGGLSCTKQLATFPAIARHEVSCRLDTGGPVITSAELPYFTLTCTTLEDYSFDIPSSPKGMAEEQN